MKTTDIFNENASDLNIGDPVVITGKVQFQGKTGDIVDFGKDKRFVIVNLYNYGKHSFHASDVSYNDYAESGDEDERMYNAGEYNDRDLDESKTGTKFVGKWQGTDSANKAKSKLVGEAKTPTSNFTIDDIKELEQMGNLDNMKQRAYELISTRSAKPMKPEKLSWFKHHIQDIPSPSKLIKLMYDLLLAGEGLRVFGGTNSTSPNSYRARFNEVKSLQSKFEKHLKKHGYDVAEKSRYWEQKLKDIDAQIAAWDAEMEKRKQQGVSEGAEFGGYYNEQLAQKVFDENPNLSTKGRADDLFKAGWKYAVQDLGKKRAQWEFGYDEDFPSDFVSAYAELQGRQQGVAEGEYDLNGKTDKVDRKKEPNTKSERYYKNKEEKKKQGVAEGSNNVRYKAHPSKKTHVVVTQVPTGHKGIKVGDEIARSDIKGWKGFSAERKKQGVAEGEYDPSYDPEYRGYQKPERNVDWDIEADRNAPEEKLEPTTVTIRDLEGNVVLQFPSTGGYYGDVRMAKSKGFDTEAGDYDIKWNRDTNEETSMNETSGATSEQVATEIVRKIIRRHPDAITAYGPEAIMAAAREVGEYFAGSEELGTSDVSVATKYTLDKLEQAAAGNLQETASSGATGAGSIAAVVGGSKNVGSLFGGTYKQKRTKKSPGTK